MIDKITENTCSGCKACGDICPVDAVHFYINREGFWYPKIDDRVCIKCNMCEKVCPAIGGYRGENRQPKVFAAWSKNDDIRINSTSGGIFYELAKQIIYEGGYIAGASYTDDFKGASHIVSNTMDGLQKIMGSKYFQSDTQGIFTEVRDLLRTNKLVLFCGTPCQNAALQRFLGRKYEQLIQCDFICRGINSPKAFRRFLEDLEYQYGSKVKSVHLKNKKNGWKSLGTFIKFKNGKEYFQDRASDAWVRGFVIGNLYMRPVCHNCRFRTIPHPSDLTLGDFWGIEGCNNDDMFKGISSVIVNTDKGKCLLEKISPNITLAEHDIKDLAGGNVCLTKNPEKGKNRQRFFEEIDDEAFGSLVSRLTPEKRLKGLKSKIKRGIKRLINL